MWSDPPLKCVKLIQSWILMDFSLRLKIVLLKFSEEVTPSEFLCSV